MGESILREIESLSPCHPGDRLMPRSVGLWSRTRLSPTTPLTIPPNKDFVHHCFLNLTLRSWPGMIGRLVVP